MYRIGTFLLLWVLAACKDTKKVAREEDDTTFNYTSFADRFSPVSLPYQLSDTGLLANKDTVTLRNPVFLGFISDSIKGAIFGKEAKVKFTPLARAEEPNGDQYFIIKGSSGTKKAALLLVFDKNGAFGATFPFLQPDNNPATTQVSTIEKTFSISRTTTRHLPNDVSADEKDVHIYNAATRGFTLIMTDALDNAPAPLINPIDTLPRSHAFAGDYGKGEKNIVSIRDAANPRELNFFIHFEKEGGCTGELKGTIFLTSSKTAVYTQSGNPCSVEFSFSGPSVTIREVGGCGSYRDIGCLFEGKFSRKKDSRKKGKELGKSK